MHSANKISCIWSTDMSKRSTRGMLRSDSTWTWFSLSGCSMSFKVTQLSSNWATSAATSLYSHEDSYCWVPQPITWPIHSPTKTLTDYNSTKSICSLGWDLSASMHRQSWAQPLSPDAFLSSRTTGNLMGLTSPTTPWYLGANGHPRFTTPSLIQLCRTLACSPSTGVSFLWLWRTRVIFWKNAYSMWPRSTPSSTIVTCEFYSQVSSIVTRSTAVGSLVVVARPQFTRCQSISSWTDLITRWSCPS